MSPAPNQQSQKEIVQLAKQNAACSLLPHLDSAPKPLDKWVGREELLSVITYDWLDSGTFITGLIGFAGEGKSSIARRWVGTLLSDEELPKPEGVFWWNFYDESSTIDLFFERAITYFARGQVDLKTLPSTKERVNLLLEMFKVCRYLVILDGVERLQSLEEDDYGLLKSPYLSQFLKSFATGKHNSFCLITSRIPILDLISYITYRQCEVEPLKIEDGRELLKKLGVKGNDILTLNKLVKQLSGHALTLNLLGNHLAEYHGGYVTHIGELSDLIDKEQKSDLVQGVMQTYDRHLTSPEREFMKKFSAVRLPVPELALEPVFQVNKSLVKRLVSRQLLSYDAQKKSYTTHPLIREFYGKTLNDNPRLVEFIVPRLKNYYLSQTREISKVPTLEELSSLIETVYLLCQAGYYNEANMIRQTDPNTGLSLTAQLKKLGAYETYLSLLQEFFPNHDTSLDPQVSASSDKSSILLEYGECLTQLGRMADAVTYFERHKRLNAENASRS